MSAASPRSPFSARAVATAALVSGVFLLLSLRGIDLQAVRSHFLSFSWLYFIPATGSLTAEIFIRAMRWRLIVTRPGYAPRYFPVFSSLFLGTFVNNLVPMRLGELVRAWVLARRQPGLSVSTIFATVCVERLADAIMLLALLLAVMLIYPLDGRILACGAALLAALAALILSSAYLHFRRARALSLFAVVLRPFGGKAQQRVLKVIDNFACGFDAFSNPAKIAGTFALTAVNWTLIIFTCWFLMAGAGIHGGLVTPVVFLVTVNVVSFLPSLPGLLGNLQFASVLFLGMQGVSESTAFTFSCIFQLFSFIYLVPVGTVLLLYEGLTPSSARLFASTCLGGQSGGGEDAAQPASAAPLQEQPCQPKPLSASPEEVERPREEQAHDEKGED